MNIIKPHFFRPICRTFLTHHDRFFVDPQISLSTYHFDFNISKTTPSNNALTKSHVNRYQIDCNAALEKEVSMIPFYFPNDLNDAQWQDYIFAQAMRGLRSEFEQEKKELAYANALTCFMSLPLGITSLDLRQVSASDYSNTFQYDLNLWLKRLLLSNCRLIEILTTDDQLITSDNQQRLAHNQTFPNITNETFILMTAMSEYNTNVIKQALITNYVNKLQGRAHLQAKKVIEGLSHQQRMYFKMQAMQLRVQTEEEKQTLFAALLPLISTTSSFSLANNQLSAILNQLISDIPTSQNDITLPIPSP